MAAPVLRLFCDRKSHPARAALLLLKTTNIQHEEVQLNLFKGEHWKQKELPFRKLPVLTHGNLTIAESTSILRYVGQLPGGEQWYGAKDLQERIKVDEFLDFWQSTLNPVALKFVQNKLMWKLFFRLKAPNQELIDEALKAHELQKDIVRKYFLAGKPFIGGETASIADLLCVCTLEQTAAGGVNHDTSKEYMERVRQATLDVYDELTEDCKKIPETLRAMKML
eukprot:GFUD01030876.1.p1 GENE.GFUD01030876.1~~GFUD01030876.1.p1  ORF type:complete len:224 (-),score=68.80 GFUD01030876.1:97-768(-)